MSLDPTRFNVAHPRWEWDMFGDRYLIVVKIYSDVPWWRRIVTRALFGSRWRRLP